MEAVFAVPKPKSLSPERRVSAMEGACLSQD